MAESDDIIDILGGLALFADLTRPQLEAVAHTFEEEWFTEDERILRQGFTGSNFYVILEGEAAVRINGQTRATVGRGEFFGEVSMLLGEEPTADVVALRPLHCLVLGGQDIERFLLSHPRVMFRMLQAQARRLRNTNLWRM
ncbi:MAG: cyclic nucleotide-binding domain-containing protein [Candidatus Rokuibacteriota bacterium]